MDKDKLIDALIKKAELHGWSIRPATYGSGYTLIPLKQQNKTYVFLNFEHLCEFMEKLK